MSRSAPTPGGPSDGTWSPERVLELHRERTTTNVRNVAAAMGLGVQGIYDAIQRGEWTYTRVLRQGRRILIPTADILVALGLTASDDVKPAAS